MKNVSMLHENGRLEIFVEGIKNEENPVIGIVNRKLVVWGKKFNIIKLPHKAEIRKKTYENNGLKIILKRRQHGN